MSVEMALAEAMHHTAPRSQRTARAREEEREVCYTAAFRKAVPPPEPELVDLFEEPGGERPGLLLEPQWPQAGVQRHTAVHIVDILPYVQILDVPVPQLGRERTGGIHAEARHCDARAGYRSAQALSR